MLLFFYAFPFLVFLTSRQSPQSLYHYIGLTEILDDLHFGKMNETEKAVILCKYVGKHVRNHKDGDKIDDVSAYEILEKGYGACDQKALVLLALAEQAGIEGHLVYLYGYDSISHHTVAELKINDSWAMLDPYFQNQYWVSANTLASVHDVVSHKVQAVDLPLIDSANYARLFDTLYPYKIVPREKPSRMNRITVLIMTLSYRIYGRYMTKPWKIIYLRKAVGRMP